MLRPALHLTIAVLTAISAPSLVHAQAAPTASLLSTAASEGVRGGLSGAVDRLLRSRLDALEVVAVQGSVALDIADVQLALGCVGETPECLAQVAAQIGVAVLILPNLDRAGDELVLSVARFDAADGQLRRAVRRARGDQAETEILDAIDGALRELFDLPPAALEPDPDPEDVDAPATTPTRQPDPVLPSITLGAGVAVLGAGIVTGVLHRGEADAYAVPPSTAEDVAERQGHRRSAEDLALATNVLVVAGGAIAAAGVVWLLVELLGGGAPAQQARVTPFVGHEVAGLAIGGAVP